MKITKSVRIQNNQWRYDPETGFLRCTATILNTSVLQYQRAELAALVIPETVLGDVIRIYVPPEVLGEAESISTLEGAPAVVGHVWQTAAEKTARCGTIAGAPSFDGAYLTADIKVTESDVVRRVMDQQCADHLREISSAYDAAVVWEPGVSPDGLPYDGYFVNLRYNHVALLPPGAGRAGETVRIINQTERPQIMDFTRVKLNNGRTVRIANDDIEALESDQAAVKAIDPAQLTEALARIEELEGQITPLISERDELKASVAALQEKLQDATSDDAVAAMAEEVANEQAEAETVAVANGIKPDASWRKLRGVALKAKVVNSVRVKNGKPELGELSKDAPYVNGMFSVYRDSAPTTGHQAPAGHAAAGAAAFNNAAAPARPQKPVTQGGDAFSRAYPQLTAK